MELLTKQEEMFLLAVFGVGKNAYLVSIREYLKENTGKDWAFGSIYITLEKLRKRGLVQSNVGKPSARQGGKAIKYYKLSEEGIRALRDNKHLQDRIWKEFTEHA